METDEKVNKGLQALEEKVISKGLCAVCGACLSLCPYLRSWKGRVVKLDHCDLSEGRCFAYCPRAEVHLNEIHQKIFGKNYEEIEMGPFRKIMMARAKDPIWRKKAQTGGVVSSLLNFALQVKMIHAGIVSPRDEDLLPQGQIIKSQRGILSASGSSYISGPTLEALNKGPWKKGERIGFVGLPCQVLALSKMKASTLEKKTPIDQVNLVIGLFCTWALDYQPFVSFLKKKFGNRLVKKLNITPPPERILEVFLGNELYRIPLDEIRIFIRPSCHVCLDMTAELSDISVGTVESKKSWNTVMVRTEKGDRLLMEAKKAGVVETRALPEDHLNHLREASLLKKKRALKTLCESGEMENTYFTLSPHLMQRLQSGLGKAST